MSNINLKPYPFYGDVEIKDETSMYPNCMINYCFNDVKTTRRIFKERIRSKYWYWRVYYKIRKQNQKFARVIFSKKQSKKYRDILDSGEKVIYLCDKKACDMCPETECKHTFDITHAVNFECFDGIHYFEKEK